MMRWLKTHVTRDMIRPLIYKVFTRGVLALFAVQLFHFFAPARWPAARFSNLALIMAGLFLLGAVIAWLRLDGMNMPQLKLPRGKRRDPAFLRGDISDRIGMRAGRRQPSAILPPGLCKCQKICGNGRFFPENTNKILHISHSLY